MKTKTAAKQEPYIWLQQNEPQGAAKQNWERMIGRWKFEHPTAKAGAL